MPHSFDRSHHLLSFMIPTLLLATLIASGCSPKVVPTNPQPNPAPESAEATTPDETPKKDDVFDAASYEASAEQLLASRLPIEDTTRGWVRLFDGHTLFGWVTRGGANWRVQNETIVVDEGSPSLLTTTTPWSDFELELEYQADAETNSGVFVRTTLAPRDLNTDCYEINIAPADNPYPTGGIVERKKGEPFDGNPDDWHVMNVVCDGDRLTVRIDDKTITQIDDANKPKSGFVGLQFRSGRVQFRNVRIRPMGLTEMLDESLSKWKRYPKMEGEFRIEQGGELVVDGGKQQLETKESFGDFTLLTDYQMDDPKSNSGIFFRCIPGDVMMGYECQVSNETIDGAPDRPADCGAGGIFRRQDARVVAGEPGRWNSILLKAYGQHFAAWVNGLQVSDVSDDRAVDVNPRKGLRTKPGTIMIQGHDPTTKATYRKILLSPGE